MQLEVVVLTSTSKLMGALKIVVVAVEDQIGAVGDQVVDHCLAYLAGFAPCADTLDAANDSMTSAMMLVRTMACRTEIMERNRPVWSQP